MAKRKFDNHNAMVNYEPPAQHPIGLAMGAAVGGAAGAAAGAAMAGAAESAVAGAATGSAAGPVGTVAGAVVGAVAGAVAGGVVGKEVAEAINPSEPDRHWRQNYHTRPYVKEGDSYEVYEAAYLYGIEAYSEYRGRHFNDIEEELARQWHQMRGESALSWENARHAARDAYVRLYKFDDGGELED